jgi:TnpA family transposase
VQGDLRGRCQSLPQPGRQCEIDRQYVDSHGQSTVAFAFCRLLGFQLLPRLKASHSQKLYRPDVGQPEAYPDPSTRHPSPSALSLVRDSRQSLFPFCAK